MGFKPNSSVCVNKSCRTSCTIHITSERHFRESLKNQIQLCCYHDNPSHPTMWFIRWLEDRTSGFPNQLNYYGKETSSLLFCGCWHGEYRSKYKVSIVFSNTLCVLPQAVLGVCVCLQQLSDLLRRVQTMKLCSLPSVQPADPWRTKTGLINDSVFCVMKSCFSTNKTWRKADEISNTDLCIN